MQWQKYTIIKLYVFVACTVCLYMHVQPLCLHYLPFLNLLVYSLLKRNINRFQTYCIGNHHKKYHAVYVISKLICLLQFSASVELGLKAGHLTPNQKSELVRDVCISINNFTNNPKRSERVWIAQQIIAKYLCMAGKTPVDSDTEWVCTI